MNNPVLHIAPFNLALSFLPVVVVIWLFHRWTLDTRTAGYAVGRMLTQLLLIGYVLTYLLALTNPVAVLGVLAVMLFASALISFRSVRHLGWPAFGRLLAATATGSFSTLLFMVVFVLELEPWYLPGYLIPLAGMTLANCMNTVALAADRLEAEKHRQEGPPVKMKTTAFHAAMIPVVNSLFAVGLVSLPGMMTGQILAGVDPLIAVRYQIIVMCMMFGSAGISAATYLELAMRSDKMNGAP